MLTLFTSRKLILPLLCFIFASFHLNATQQKTAHMTAYRYNILGQQTGVIYPDPDGSGPLPMPAVRNTYNAKGLLVLVENGALVSWQNETIAPANWGSAFDYITNTIAYTYDKWGRKETAKVTNNGTDVSLTHYSYNGENLLECETKRMDPSSFYSLPASACTAESGGAYGSDRVTKFLYNNFGQVTDELRAVGTDLEQIYKHYDYNENYTIVGVTDANGNKTTWEYDGHNRLKKWYFPHKTNTGVSSTSDYEQYGYDNNGNRTSLRKRDGKVINYTFDKLNRVTFKNIPNSTSLDVYYKYDNRDVELQARYASHSGLGIKREFDGFGRVEYEDNNTTGTNYRIAYQYDDNGNRTRVTHPDNKYFQYDYDGLNRQTLIRENSTTANTLITHVFNAKSELNSINRSNNAPTNFAYDDISRVNGITHNLSGTANDNTYGYSYNPANQLTQLTLSNTAYHHNNSTIGHQGAYEVNGLNQYTKVNGKTLTNDANGNLTNDGFHTYTYDVENRLKTTSNANTLFTYDPLGRLSTYKANGATRKFIYDGDSLIAEYSGSTLVKRYVHGMGIDKPLVAYNSSSVGNTHRQFLYANHQGSIVAEANYAGAKSYINTYDSYGVPASGNQGRFGYTGQLYLSEIGLNYYKARIYHPKLGRFLQTDPVGYEDQMNLYAYVGNDPVNMVDPSGMMGQRGINNKKIDPQTRSKLEARIKELNGKTDKDSKAERNKIKNALKADDKARKNRKTRLSKDRINGRARIRGMLMLMIIEQAVENSIAKDMDNVCSQFKCVDGNKTERDKDEEITVTDEPPTPPEKPEDFPPDGK